MSATKDYVELLKEQDPGNVLKMYAAELLDCHSFLDMAGIPKVTYSERLSISQRVQIAAVLLIKQRVAA